MVTGLSLVFCFMAVALGQVQFWLTTANKSSLFSKQPDLPIRSASGNPTIEISPQSKQQQMDGFGWCLTGGSASVIHALPNATRAALLQELFSSSSFNIGTSFLRLTIGASDMSDHVFTYDDIPSGDQDPQLKNFSLGPDLAHVVPVLKEILTISPGIKLLGSPWTAPSWMKTQYTTKGAQLKNEQMSTYADYFVKYIQEMNKHGIEIFAITPQNEPLNPNNNPSMYMDAKQQALFIKNHLGPAFQSAGLSTKIIIYDHNADRIDYPIDVMSDAEALKYIDGSAFHLYAGDVSAFTTVHNKFPSKGIYFTEQWVAAPEDDSQFSSNLQWAISNLIIGGTQNWCKAVIQWNLATDPNWRPHTDGGCVNCLGALTIFPNGSVKRNSGYYTIAHASKFVVPDSFKVTSTFGLPNSAFVRPDGKIVVVVSNNRWFDLTTTIKIGGQMVSTNLPSGSISTFVW